MEFLQLKEEEFVAFADTHPLRNMWQTKEMAETRRIRGFDIYYVGVKEEGKIIAGSMISTIPLFMGYKYAQALRGYLIDFNNFELLDFFHNNVVKFLKDKKCLKLRIDPYLEYCQRDLDGNPVEGGFNNQPVVDHLAKLGYKHNGFTRGIDLGVEPRWMYTIPYKGLSADELFKTFERNCQRSIKNTEKFNVTVRELQREDLHLFMDVMKHTEERREFEGRDETYYTMMYDVYSKNDNIKFLYCEENLVDYLGILNKDLQAQEKIEADALKRLETQNSKKMRNKLNEAQNQITQLHKKIDSIEALRKEKGDIIVLSSGVFFTYGRETICLMSGVYDEYMQFASPFAMHWKMMKEGIEKEQDRYNLYGISGIFEKEANDYGVYLFKKEWNGEVNELLGEFDYIFHPSINNLYNTLRSIKHKIKG